MSDMFDRWVQQHLTEMRAPLKKRTMFTVAGRSVQRSAGERIVYGPNGQPVRVVELPEGGNQIEQDDRLHAVVRPQTLRLKLKVSK